ncbi:hypothetical protein DID80_03740 [Candidatus Marinamargulisbacteria bacterium SCGC AAA071-K20]|nr:hypothetical protein DID80_03740 [Candidatus Marinamargulisbacteria bacterium SCGC AAA071-K20]
MFDLIWGLKTTSLMDVWSIDHVLSGMSVGYIAYTFNRSLQHKYSLKVENETFFTIIDIVLVLLLAFMWETFEHYLEIGLMGSTVEYWFQGVEYWANRFIFDPLMLVVGYFYIRSHGSQINVFRVLSVLWLVVHIFIFPHSMYLHEIF